MVHNIRKSSLSMADGLFEDLDGIEGPRDVQVREETTLEKLLKIERNLQSEIRTKWSPHFNSQNYTYRCDNGSKCYCDIYRRIEQELKGIDITEDELKGFIITNSNIERELFESIILGMYTGSLLQLFTERNRRQGKRTRFYINGDGSYFPFLFYCAKDIDDVFVDDFKGEGICSLVGSFGGKANNVIVRGEGNHLTSYVGSVKGRVKNVILLDAKGKDIATGIGVFNGDVDNVILLNCMALRDMAEACGVSGRVGNLIIINSNSPHITLSIGNSWGRVDNFLSVNGCVSQYASQYACEDSITHSNGYVGNAIFINLKKNTTSYFPHDIYASHGGILRNLITVSYDEDKLPQILAPTVMPDKIIIREDCRVFELTPQKYKTELYKTELMGDAAFQKYKRILQKNGLGEITELALAMENKTPEDVKTPEEVFSFADEISECYSKHNSLLRPDNMYFLTSRIKQVSWIVSESIRHAYEVNYRRLQRVIKKVIHAI